MQNLRNSILFLLLSSTFTARAQNTEVILNYINTYKNLAIEEMQRTGVPAAIKLAQGIHETTAGTSDLVQKSNNHFGIKCKDTWTGQSVNHDDDARGECFRKYPSAIESYRDHSDFLKSSDRYSFLFRLEPTDYKDWAYGLKKAGYATNPRYPQIIIGLIEDYHLQDYTLIALGKMPATENAIVKTTLEDRQKQTTPALVSIIKQEEPIKQPEKIIEKAVYPEGGEFKINETRVIYAKKGTSFLAIAQQYNVPLARVFEFNDMTQTEAVNKDQLIYLQRKRKTGNNEFHTIQSGETLYDIAQQEAIRLETLLEYNLLKQDMKPAIGEQLNLRTKAAAMPKLAMKENYSLYSTPTGSITMNTYATENAKPQMTSSIQTTTVYYTVQSKETIYAISKKYNVNIDDIVKWNQLNGYGLKTGQQLKIYK
jgi:LysM repeat protein